MNRGANSDSIPNDLIPEILSRLPAKSIARFRCVSKLWKSIICRQDFTELFHTRSSSNPRLLIGVERGDEWSFFSSPQPQNHYGKSSPVVTADFHMKFSKDIIPYYCIYASGLTYFPNIHSKDGDDKVRVICNPKTGQYATLPPDLNNCYGFLGFDAIGKQFKVLVLSIRDSDELSFDILTLGTGKMRWRNIHCPLTHYPRLWYEGIYINGVLYYLAQPTDEMYKVIVCFDVRSEKFKFLNLNPDSTRNHWSTKLINYKGKLGVINFEDDYDGGFPLKLRMWVVENVEKQEWTTYAYTLRAENKVVKDDEYISVVGVTALGEIVLAKKFISKPFYVFYFNPERDTLLSVEIQGVREEEEWFNDHAVSYFLDHVEDLRFDVMKITYAATSISAPEHSTSTSSREKICINGVLYYITSLLDDVIGCFDVKSEKFKFLHLNPDCFSYSSTTLINYKGKLGVINLENSDNLELRMWVLEDVEKQEWTTYAYTLRDENEVDKEWTTYAYTLRDENEVDTDDDCISVVGVTASGEIVLAKDNAYKPFYVFYFNPERNTLRSVEVQGVREEEEWFNDHRVYYFVDHVENLAFDVMKTTYAATSISQPEQSTSTSSREDHQVRTVAHLEQDRRTFESVNKFDALCLLEDD